MMCVQWAESKAEYFPMLNGFKLGAISNLVLFCVCINVLLAHLKYAIIGCWIGNIYVDIIIDIDIITIYISMG